MSDFRVEKAKAAAILTLSNGATVWGCFFVSGLNAAQTGPERVSDVLNAEEGFFPFEVIGPNGARTALYHRRHVMTVALENHNEPGEEPGYDVAPRVWVSMLLSDGSQVSGAVRVYCPPGHARLSDYARTAETFRYLETSTDTLLVNIAHVVELVETEEHD
jgi:hypothetical protein